jgi:hypothetical protein
MLLGPGNPGQ